MRTPLLELYFDFSSPYAYLGHTQAAALAQRASAQLVYRPMLLGAVFKAIGQVDAPMLTWSEPKRLWTIRDLEQWAAHYGVPFRFPSRFPMGTVKALRCYLALEGDEKAEDAFRAAVFRGYWAEDRDIASDEVLSEILAASGADAAAVLAKTQDKAIKDALFAATQRATSAGVFGAPTWVVDGNVKELVWGQDRIPLVEDQLKAALRGANRPEGA